MRQKLAAPREVPADRRDRAALRLQPGLPGLRQDPAPDRHPAPAPQRRGRARRRWRSAARRCARSPAASRCCTPRSTRMVDALVERKIFVYLCTNAVLLQRRLDRLQAVAVLLVRRPHRRAARAPRRGRRPRRRVRHGRRGDPRRQAAGLPGHHQLDVLQHRLAQDGARRARLPQRRPRGRRDDDLARPTPTRRRPTRSTSSACAQTQQLFRDAFADGRRRKWRLNHTPLFLDFLEGRVDFECTAWAIPSLLGARLAAAVLPDERRLRVVSTRSSSRRPTGTRTGAGKRSALRQLHGPLRLRADGGGGHHPLAARVATRPRERPLTPGPSAGRPRRRPPARRTCRGATSPAPVPG